MSLFWNYVGLYDISSTLNVKKTIIKLTGSNLLLRNSKAPDSARFVERQPSWKSIVADRTKENAHCNKTKSWKT